MADEPATSQEAAKADEPMQATTRAQAEPALPHLGLDQPTASFLEVMHQFQHHFAVTLKDPDARVRAVTGFESQAIWHDTMAEMHSSAARKCRSQALALRHSIKAVPYAMARRRG